MEYKTDYGMVSVDELIRVYHQWKKMVKKNIEKRNEYNQTEEGKQKNRERARVYYESHRELILEKRRKQRDECQISDTA